jgi:hypothetical protein
MISKESVCGLTEVLSRDLPAGTFDTYKKPQIVRGDSNRAPSEWKILLDQPVQRNKRKRLDTHYAFFEQRAQNGRMIKTSRLFVRVSHFRFSFSNEYGMDTLDRKFLGKFNTDISTGPL